MRVYGYSNQSAWLFVRRKSYNPRSEQETIGWKIHISLDDSVSDNGYNLDEGWKIVCRILTKNRINCFKVIKSYALPDTQAHKQITVYAESNSKDPEFWSNILSQIESEYKKYDIKPNLRPKIGVDHAIEGSEFFSYRNDKNIITKNGCAVAEYIAASNATSYNQSGEEDPFINLCVKTKDAVMSDESGHRKHLRE